MNTMTLNALAEPSRFRIVELLRDRPYPVGEIAKRLLLRQPQVSKHLSVLSEAGLVEVRAVAQQRIYQLQARPFEELDSWLETFQRLWDTRLDTLDGHPQELRGQDSQKAAVQKAINKRGIRPKPPIT